MIKNKATSKPELKDALALLKKEVMLALNCHAIARITAVNYSARTVEAEMLYTKSFFETDQFGAAVQRELQYPLLLDVPFMILSGGSSRLTFPIAAGDECLILFNDRDIDNYMAGAKSGPVKSQRLHSFADGIALVGFKFDQDEYDQTRAVLSFGTTKVGVGETKVLIGNADSTLNELLAQLVDDIKDLVTQVAAITVTGVTTGGGTSGPPANVAAINAVTTQLTSTANAIGGLLE